MALGRAEDLAKFFDYDLDLSTVNRTKVLQSVKAGFGKIWESPQGKTVTIGAAIYVLAFKGGFALARLFENKN